MTQKEIEKFLASTKVYVAGKSKEIQEKLFSLGYKWDIPGKKVSYTDKPFIFIWEDKSLSYSDNMEYFTNKQYIEIAANEILFLELTEPKYRPFKDKEECWKEMLKHHPFGWLKHKEEQFYLNWVCINDDGIDSTPFSNAYDDYTFVDGAPFGIKEE